LPSLKKLEAKKRPRKKKRKKLKARRQRLMPVIQATQKAEIRRIKFQSQSGQIVGETLSQKKKQKTKKPITKKDW
jgi:hypothetical protein